MANYEVIYTIKHTEKGYLYGLLVERKNKFEEFSDAIKFAREIAGTTKNGVTVVGKPVVNCNTEKAA
jgi:putative AlgH/UPF0301 family transcriptional regulator